MTSSRKSFSKTLPLQPDESLNGYFLRVAKDLVLPGPSSILPATGAEARNLSEFHRTGAGLEAVAARLGVSKAELDRRRYEAVPEFVSLVSFAGNWIERAVFSGGSPRIAPHAFRASGIHRMSWDLIFVIADPATGECLIGACPHCSTDFSWGKSDFLACHACGESIAVGAPDLVDEDTRVAIAGLADLVSLDPERAKTAGEALAPEIRDLGTGRLFKFVFSLAAGMDEEKAARRPKNAVDRLIEPRKPGHRTTHLDWSQAVLRAYQIATGWPDALLGYLEEEKMISEERAGAYGTKKAFGYFQILLREWSAEAEIWAVVVPAVRTFLEAHPEMSLKAGTPLAEAVGDVSDGIMLRDVKAKYGWSHRRITELLKFPGVLLSEGQGSGTPLRISRKKVDEVMLALQGMISARTLRGEWRLRHDVVADLCDSGLLKQVEPEYLRLVGMAKALYRRVEIDAIATALEASVHPMLTSGTQVTTKVVVEMLKEHAKYPWSFVVSAVLNGNLVPIRFDSCEHNLLERMIFDRDSAHKWAYGQMGIENPTHSLDQVADRLMVNSTVVAALIRDGRLQVCRDLHGGPAARILSEDLNKFDQQYISQNKLRKVCEAKQRGRKIHPDLIVGSCRFFGVELFQPRGVSMRFYPRHGIPKNFRIIERKELHESGALRNNFTIGKNDPDRRPRP
jgi:hypothetical protein